MAAKVVWLLLQPRTHPGLLARVFTYFSSSLNGAVIEKSRNKLGSGGLGLLGPSPTQRKPPCPLWGRHLSPA